MMGYRKETEVIHSTENDCEPSPSKTRRRGNMDIENACQMFIDNSANVLKTIRNLYYERQMCDVNLIVGKKEHPAHRLILCACSDVFQAMLMNPKWNECHKSNITLQELPHCERVFSNFLEYFYTGKIIINQTNVLAILSLADKYIVKSLTRLCLEYMATHIPQAAAHSVLYSWLQYTTSCGHDVSRHCCNYIKWNLCAVANTPEFSEFDVEFLVNMLQQSDIIVYNEMVLYNFTVRWLDLQKINLQQSGLSKDEVEKHVDHLVEVVMSHIRFPMMTPRELAELLLSPLIKRYKEFFVERMAIGMAFHSGQKERVEEICVTDEGKLLFSPRLYVSDSFSSVLSIDNFKSLPCYHTCTFVFSSHVSVTECETDRINEWVVDLYPKGVWFKKCFLILWQGPIEVPEEVLPTVRLSLSCREVPSYDIKVKIGILLYAKQGGIEYIVKVIEKVHYFNAQNRICNMDNIIPFEELNPTAMQAGDFETKYLIGSKNDQLRINIVITPLSPQ